MNWIGILQIVLIIAATGVSARGSQATGRSAGTPLLAARVGGRQLSAKRNIVQEARSEGFVSGRAK
jgi:hypothetical protein